MKYWIWSDWWNMKWLHIGFFRVKAYCEDLELSGDHDLISILGCDTTMT